MAYVSVGKQQIIAVIEPRSNSIKLGAHREGLAPSTLMPIRYFGMPDNLGWDAGTVTDARADPRLHPLPDIIAGVVAGATRYSRGDYE